MLLLVVVEQVIIIMDLLSGEAAAQVEDLPVLVVMVVLVHQHLAQTNQNHLIVDLVDLQVIPHIILLAVMPLVILVLVVEMVEVVLDIMVDKVDNHVAMEMVEVDLVLWQDILLLERLLL